MRPLNQLIDRNLIRKARALQDMTLSLRSRLSAPLAEHCWAAGWQDKTLIVITDSGAWATGIRYQQHELLKQINAEFRLDLKRMKIRIARGPLPKSAPPVLAPRRPANRSVETDLQALLTRLARRGR